MNSREHIAIELFKLRIKNFPRMQKQKTKRKQTQTKRRMGRGGERKPE